MRGVLVGKWTRQPITGTVMGFCDVYVTRSKGSYKNGLKHGQWEQWDCKTDLLAVSANYKDGKRDGLYKAFWENGKLMEAGIYSNGTIQTSNAFYWESGELMQMNSYDKVGNFISSKCYKEDGKYIPCD